MRISDWSSYVCSSDLLAPAIRPPRQPGIELDGMETTRARDHSVEARPNLRNRPACAPSPLASAIIIQSRSRWSHAAARLEDIRLSPSPAVAHAPDQPDSSASVERLHQLVLRSLDNDQHKHGRAPRRE